MKPLHSPHSQPTKIPGAAAGDLLTVLAQGSPKCGTQCDGTGHVGLRPILHVVVVVVGCVCEPQFSESCADNCGVTPQLIFAYNRVVLVFCTFLTVSLDDAKNLK